MSQLSHTPLQPPRPGTPGEAIYLQLWQDYIATRQDDWRWIFNDLSSEIDQRTATVAASFMTWMECNAGMDFTHQAIRIWKTGVRSEEHTSELQSLMRISYAVFC